MPDGRCQLHPQLARAVVAIVNRDGCGLDQPTIAAGAARLRTVLAPAPAVTPLP